MTLLVKRRKEAERKKTETDKTLQTMASMFVNHTFQVSQGDACRFPSNQFGFSLSSNYSPFLLQDFEQVLRRYMRLEIYCDAVESSGASLDSEQKQGEPDLFQALFFPKSIAPRTPMRSVTKTLMTEGTLSSMWFRLVAHYFEWLAGISELQYFSDEDKLRLAVCQLCKVICFSVVYLNYEKKNGEENEFLFFGSGYYWDPARSHDPLMTDYCTEMNRAIKQVLSPVRKVRLTKEEYVLAKLILLFDCTNLIGISVEGLEFARSMCSKYRTTLSNYVRNQAEERANLENWTEEQINWFSMQRIRSILDMPIGIEKLGKLDDDILVGMVEANYGGMRGTLQQQIHTESKKFRHFR
ncbi:unnamed protein product [Caenorhabditis sp. 36 PRJEB53466]|nr:unnamed protein product [Caenorhabditis sp. 36 PRJEB53466]